VKPRPLREALGGATTLAIPLALVALIATAVASPSEMRTVVNFLITVTLVVALQSFSGNSGIVSFGHVAFMGIGAYVGALVTIPEALKESQLPNLPGWLAGAELSYVPTLLVAAVVAALVAAVLAVVLARMAEGAMAMATIGVLFVFFNVFENWDGVTRGSSGIYGVPQSTDVWSALAFAILAIAIAIAFRSSRWGMQLRASAVDPVAAETLGVRVVRLRYAAWIVSAGLMGLGGAIWSQYNLAFDPSQFYLPLTFTLLAIVVVGGIGSVSGVVVGAALITVVQEVVRRVEAETAITGLTQITVALLILAVLYARPAGIVGPVELSRRLAPLIPRRPGGSKRA
jgi:branched-chain amino acid transport system permease protein